VSNKVSPGLKILIVRVTLKRSDYLKIGPQEASKLTRNDNKIARIRCMPRKQLTVSTETDGRAHKLRRLSLLRISASESDIIACALFGTTLYSLDSCLYAPITRENHTDHYRHRFAAVSKDVTAIARNGETTPHFIISPSFPGRHRCGGPIYLKKKQLIVTNSNSTRIVAETVNEGGMLFESGQQLSQKTFFAYIAHCQLMQTVFSHWTS
jgi:hypothetical protein